MGNKDRERVKLPGGGEYFKLTTETALHWFDNLFAMLLGQGDGLSYILDPKCKRIDATKLARMDSYREDLTKPVDPILFKDFNLLFTIISACLDDLHLNIFKNEDSNPLIGFNNLKLNYFGSTHGSPVFLIGNIFNNLIENDMDFLNKIHSVKANLLSIFPNGSLTIDQILSVGIVNRFEQSTHCDEAIKNFLVQEFTSIDHKKFLREICTITEMKARKMDTAKVGTQTQVAMNAVTTIKCSHCGKGGHAISNCFKLVGYPPKRKDKPYVKQEDGNGNKEDTTYSSLSIPKKRFVVDSGATNTMVKDALVDSNPINLSILTANGQMQATEKGNLKLCIDGSVKATMKDVLVCPDLHHNLLSIPALTKEGYTITFRETGWEAIHAIKSKCFSGQREGDLYFLNLDHNTPRASLSATLIQCADDPTVKIVFDVGTGTWTASRDDNQIACGTTSKEILLADLHKSKQVQHEILQTWHESLNHLSLPRMKELAKSGAINGFTAESFDISISELPCKICIETNLKSKRFPKNKSTPATRIGQKVHIDGKGPIDPVSRYGSRYVLTVIDDFSKKRFSKVCKSKSDYTPAFIEIATQIENHCGRPIEYVRSDNEFRNNAMAEWCRVKGATQQFTVPSNPSQNGVAERAIGEEFALVRTLLKQAQLSFSFWEDARMFVDFILDCRLTIGNGSKQTPFEIWFNKKPYLDFMKPFGAKCFVQIPNIANKSLGDRAMEAIYLGPSFDQKGFRVLLQNQATLVSRTVVFLNSNGSKLPVELKSPSITQSAIQPVLDDDEDDSVLNLNPINETINNVVEEELTADENPNASEEESITDNNDEFQSADEADVTSLNEGNDDDSVDHSVDNHSSDNGSTEGSTPTNLQSVLGSWWNTPSTRPGPRRANLTIKQRKQQALNSFAIPSNPVTIKQALARSDSSQWKKAITDELDAMFKNGVIEKVPVAKESKGKLISSKMVFDIKQNADGTIERYKARLVAKGFLQINGVHYSETHSPVASMNSVKMLCSIAAINDLELHQLDVTAAFLIPDLKEELYLQFPAGIEAFDARIAKGTVWRLKKTLYGLKQSSHEWNIEADSFLKSIGFKPCLSDTCIYVRNEEKGDLSYIALYVDDLLVASKNIDIIKSIKEKVTTKWACRDLGEAKKFLGLVLTRDRATRTMHLSQELLVKECLAEMVLEHGENMTNCVPTTIPYDLTDKLVKCKAGSVLLERTQAETYHSLVGKLLYIAGSTRPDLSVSVSMLASYVSNPTDQHWNALKKVLRYCKGTMTDGLVLGGNHKTAILVGYSDSDWSACLDTRRSRSGYTFFLGSGCISHQSKKQTTVALSTCEAEYLGLSAAVVELQWLKRLLAELGFPQEFVEMNQDNAASIHLAEGRGKFSASKHIELRHHKCREVIENGEMRMRWIPTSDMIADIMTKPLAKPTFLKLKEKLNIINREEFKNKARPKSYADAVNANLSKGAVGYATLASTAMHCAMSALMTM